MLKCFTEAVKIERRVGSGKKIVNSKSEFNRYELPGLKVGTRKQTLVELQEDDEETKKLKDRKKKKNKKRRREPERKDVKTGNSR